jgi:hypothetical protein
LIDIDDIVSPGAKPPMVPQTTTAADLSKQAIIQQLMQGMNDEGLK